MDDLLSLAAPLLPLFWIASVEVIAASDHWKHVPSFVSRAAAWLVIVGCVAAQIWLGPVSRIVGWQPGGKAGPALSAVTVVDAPPLEQSFAATGKRQLVLAVDEQDATRFFRLLGSTESPVITVVRPGLSRDRRRWSSRPARRGSRRRCSCWADTRGIVVLKRCVDVDDLLAAASAGQADVAVLGLDAPGLDPTAVELLRRHEVRAVAVVPDGAAPRPRGCARHGSAADARRRVGPGLAARRGRCGRRAPASGRAASAEPSPALGSTAAAEPVAARAGVVVWGPGGAPGRTTAGGGAGGRAGAAAAADRAGGRRSVRRCRRPAARRPGRGVRTARAARLTADGELGERFGSVQRGSATT